MEQPYVVVLAGGEGNRLASLTRALYGVDLPKQFAVLSGQRSLLQSTVERAHALTCQERIFVVVTAHQEALARAQLALFPAVELVVQPTNLDTAPGMLLPLARIVARDPAARVIYLPSDHFIANPAPIDRALLEAAHAPLADRIALIGVAPTSAEKEYGWIATGARIGATHAYEVAAFREKPSDDILAELHASGALWNTFISAGAAATFWRLAKTFLPLHAAALERYAVAIGGLDEQAALDGAYAAMPAANFSRDVFAHAVELAVMPVRGTGWTDWGSPSRVFESLAGTPCHDRLVARMREAKRDAA